MAKKYFALFLAILIIATCFSACTTNNTSDKKVVTQSTTKIKKDTNNFKLSYTQSDSLNPYQAKTLNNQVVNNLVFDSLFVLDENFKPQPQIATSYSYTNPTTLSVIIKSGVKFSDGTPLTSKNVVTSFENAKDSPQWGNDLSGIDSAKADTDTQITFKLKSSNPYAHSLLTFAIAKEETDKNNYPIGSGRYKYNNGNGDVFIDINKNYPDFKPNFTKILLMNITSDQSIDNAMNISNISFAFRDMAQGNSTRIACNKKIVNMNNLVYIGLNNKSGLVSNKNIRKAISLAIDRSAIVKSAYQGYGKSATSVFNPSSEQGKTTSVFSQTADIDEAKQLIQQSGIDKNNLKITLLTNNNDNRVSACELIKKQLQDVGFTVNITKQNAKSYNSSIKNQNFDIYIGETKLSNDMNLSSFFTSNGATHYGIDVNKSNTAKAYTDYLKGNTQIGKFMIEFSDEMPFVPVCYRQGMICYSKSVHGDMQGYYTNYFYNIQDWFYN